MKRARINKTEKIHRILSAVPWGLLTLYYAVMLILGEDTVMGNPVLRAIWDINSYIFSALIVLQIIILFAFRLWDKKHPPKEDKQVPEEDGRSPHTD